MQSLPFEKGDDVFVILDNQENIRRGVIEGDRILGMDPFNLTGTPLGVSIENVRVTKTRGRAHYSYWRTSQWSRLDDARIMVRFWSGEMELIRLDQIQA